MYICSCIGVDKLHSVCAVLSRGPTVMLVGYYALYFPPLFCADFSDMEIETRLLKI